jgi:hypothetical protein
MAVWELRGENLTLEISGNIGMVINDPNALALLNALLMMHSFTTVSKFRCSIEDSSQNRYSYKIELSDGRQWKQDLYMRADDVYMTFSVSDLWKLNEFEKHREIRNYVIALLKERQIYYIKATWS